MLEIILNWLRDELREMKKVPAAIVLFVAVAFGVGWWSAGLFYAERIQVLQLQLDAAVAGRAISVQPSGPSTLFSINWPGTTLWSLTGIAVLVCVVLVVSNRRKRLNINALVEQVRGLREMANTESKQREGLRTERDEAVVALKDKKTEYAMETLQRYKFS